MIIKKLEKYSATASLISFPVDSADIFVKLYHDYEKRLLLLY